LFQNFLKSVYFAATFSFVDALQIQVGKLRCENLVNDVHLLRLELIIFRDELKTLLSLQ